MNLNDRLNEIEAFLNDPQPRGFRGECRDLVEICRCLRKHNDQMAGRDIDPDEISPDALEERCRAAGVEAGSQLLIAACFAIRCMRHKLREAEDVAKDAVDPARVNVNEPIQVKFREVVPEWTGPESPFLNTAID